MPDPVTRLNAALEGRYHIESELGEGGMATVYLAKDMKHNRNVALKVLKPDLAAVAGPDGRFVMVKMAPGTFRQFKVIHALAAALETVAAMGS